MLTQSRLAVLMAVLTLHGQVHAGRVIGGHEAPPHSRPYMVLLERVKSNGVKIFCGGFLLTEDFVMTAAHCQAEKYTALIGLHSSLDMNKDVQRIPVSQAFPHEHYNQAEYTNDLMILKLSSKAKFNSNVQPIDLADQDDGSLPTSCSVSGWGQTTWEENYITQKLMEVSVTLIKNETCTKDHVYCSKGETGPGVGDSGGPLVCEGGKVYGVVSSRLENPSHHSALFRYAKIPDCKDWIISTVKKALIRN